MPRSNVTVTRDVQFMKEWSQSVKVAGMVIDFRPLLLKFSLSIQYKELGSLTLSRDVQPEKTNLPMVSNPSLKVTDTRSVQFANVYTLCVPLAAEKVLPRLRCFTPAGMVTLVKPLFWNVYVPR